ncbi:MAG: acetyltransferase [Proteobacteria bacterium]|nr:MAG: acetyltransferase [Pseudomonadota bacterium]
MPLKNIAIFGAGGFGLEVAMLIQQINAVSPTWNIHGFFDDGIPPGTRVNDWEVLGGVDELNSHQKSLAVAFALGMSNVREAVVHRLNNPVLYFPTLIHPSVILGSPDYVEIGEGGIICANTIITTNICIGRFAILNLACTVGHETVIGDYCSFMPTCNISGEVTIGNVSFWGTGAKVINRCTVGGATTIGAGAVIVSDIPDHATAVGVPAKVIKTRQ